MMVYAYNFSPIRHMYKLFRQLEPGEKIVIGADPADGGLDYCAAQAYSLRHHDYPFVLHERMEATQFGHELYKMALFIHKMTGEWPLIAVEKNIGSATIYVLMGYNYTNMFRMPKNMLDPTAKDEEKGEIGWLTNQATRMMAVDGFALALKQHAIKIYDMLTVKECMTFVVGRKGKPEAANGSHDDLVMAAAIALKVAEISPKTKTITKEQMAAKSAQFPQQQVFDDTGISNV